MRLKLPQFCFLGVLLGASASHVALAADFTERQICRAGIAALFGRSPMTVKVDSESGGVLLLSYRRPDDGTRWTYRCRVDGWRIMWGSVDGRWRDDPRDEIVEFTSTPTTLKVDVSFVGEKATTHKFTKAQLKE